MKTPGTMNSDQTPPVGVGGAADPRSPYEPVRHPSPDHTCVPSREPSHDPQQHLQRAPKFQVSGNDLNAKSLQAMAALQPGKSRLELLPNELLVITFEALASVKLDITEFEAYKEYKDDLRSLCLVSKTMAVIARPALYRDIRLYGHMAVVRLCATFCLVPTLASNVKSILLCPSDDPYYMGIRTIDLRPLRPFQDPSYAFWIKGRGAAKVRMPQKTRAELICTLFSKILSMIPALESLYFKLPKLHPITSKDLERLPADPQFMRQLSLQAVLFQDFCQGQLLPNLSKLGTVGILGEKPAYDAEGLCERLFHAPKLHEVLRASYCSGDRGHNNLQYWDLVITDSKDITTKISTSVKKMDIRTLFVEGKHMVDLTTAFPSLESLAIDECQVYGHSSPLTQADRTRLFQLLGGLENFHTLELDVGRQRFALDITTESGSSTIVTLSGLSKLSTLLVPVDFFVGFTSDNKQPHVHRETTILPDSLRHLTLLLDYRCTLRMTSEGDVKMGSVELMAEPFLLEVVPALLVEFPHLEQVDLCYGMEDYRQHRVYPLAADSQPLKKPPLE